ncbi:thioredoxin domain-containing protein [Longibacter salinarum]|nr:thioredoxin domain-containing protein [Longibacter salinarum]
MSPSSILSRIGRGIALVSFLVLLFPTVTSAQDEGLDTQRIIDNLKMEIPQLRQTGQVSLSSFSDSEIDGFKRATLTVNGRQIPMLVTPDGSQALLLAGPPINVSRSVEEVQDALAAESSERGAALARAAKGMPVRGPADAPVTLVEFSDFQCPYCARASSLVNELMSRYPETLNVVYIHYPLPMHEWARPAAVASQCAARQSDDAFWTLHDAYFDNQNDLTEANVVEKSESYLADASIDMDEWRTCAQDSDSAAHQEVQETIEANMQAGRSVNVTGTPSFYINGQKVQGARSVEAFARLIDQAAANAQ